MKCHECGIPIDSVRGSEKKSTYAMATDPAHKFGDEITLGYVGGTDPAFMMGDKARLLLEAWHQKQHSEYQREILLGDRLGERLNRLREVVAQAENGAETLRDKARRNGLQYALAIMEGRI